MKFLYIVLAIALFIFPQLASGQDKHDRIVKLQKEAERSINKRAYDDAYSYLQTSNQQLEDFQSDSLMIRNHLLLSRLFMYRNHADSAVYFGQLAYDGAASISDKTLLLEANLAIGEGLYYAGGDPYKSIYYFEEAENMLSEINTNEFDYKTNYNLLVANRAIGKIDNAQQYGLLLEDLFSRSEMLLDNVAIANAYYIIAMIYLELYSPKALQYLLKADSIMESKAGPGNYYQVNYYYPLMANYWNQQKDYANALKYYKKIETFSPYSYHTNSQNLINQAWTYMLMEDFLTADSLVDIYLTLAKSKRDSVFAYKTKAKVALGLNQPEAAIRQLTLALQKLYPGNKKVELPRIEQMADPYDEHELYEYLGNAYLMKAQQSTGTKYENLARQYLWFALEAGLHNRPTVRHHNAQITLSRHIKPTYTSLLDYYYFLYKKHNDYHFVDTASMLINHAKATIIKSKSRLFESSGIPDHLRLERSSLLNQIEESKLKSKDAEAIFALFTELEEVDNRISKYQNTYEEAFFQEQYDTGNDEIILNYHWGKDVIYLTSKGSNKRFLRIKLTNELDSLINQFSQSVKNPQRQSFDQFQQTGNQLYQVLLEPILRDHIPKQITIIPDEKLLTIPFEALPNNQSGNSYFNADYLIRHTNIAFAPYEGKQITEEDNGNEKAVSFAFNTSIENHLPKYLGKVEAESQMFEKALDALSFKGINATETNYKAAGQSHGIQHLAVHGTATGDVPYLEFRTEQEDENDGKLYEYEIFNMQIPARLVLLTACETNMGEIASSEGVISLSRAFLAAGVQSVISSLWTLNDDAALVLFDGFLEEYTDSDNAVTALGEAKRAYLARADEIKAHPYFWAGLVVNRKNLSRYDSDIWIVVLPVLIITLVVSVGVSLRLHVNV